MSRKLTRRQWVAAAASPALVAQGPKAPEPPADDLQAAKERVRKDGERLTAYQLPMSTEPAFHFKA